MPGRAPRRYKTDRNGDTRPAFHGKLPEEFNKNPLSDIEDMVRSIYEEETAAV